MAQERNGLMGTIGRLSLQLLVPALVAAGASYVAVATQLVRLEERIESLRTEMHFRYNSIEHDVHDLHAADERLAKEIDVVRVR